MLRVLFLQSFAALIKTWRNRENKSGRVLMSLLSKVCNARLILPCANAERVKMCDNCNKKGKTTTVHILTGKRGRPPKKEYCAACLDSEKGTYILPGEKVDKSAVSANGEKTESPKRETAQVVKARQSGFHESCLFLLHLLPDSLFEAIGTGYNEFRCKGCSDPVSRTERLGHHSKHKAELL